MTFHHLLIDQRFSEFASELAGLFMNTGFVIW